MKGWLEPKCENSQYVSVLGQADSFAVSLQLKVGARGVLRCGRCLVPARLEPPRCSSWRQYTAQTCGCPALLLLLLLLLLMLLLLLPLCQLQTGLSV